MLHCRSNFNTMFTKEEVNFVSLKEGVILVKFSNEEDREVLAIDWRDRDNGWIEYMCIRIIIDIHKPLRRVVHYVDKEGVELVCAIWYERLPRFCYICGLIGHTTQKCVKKEASSKTHKSEFQYVKIKARRKRVRGSNQELTEESPSRMVRRKLLDRLTPSKTAAGEQPRQDQ
ncbi:hypothetical protein Goari_020591 [Gossypium aridum]|uniref:Zinc knuckle CX2CX4HX4C domain-containing protein n=1 Tax=Gossypium aridum TaxID=34290 RepID=A0A7J8YNB0_GOSAI|nr:hypothetical protein [Gossypium aridum]